MRCHTRVDPLTDEDYLEVDDDGLSLLLDPLTNKGTAFPELERVALHLDGLLPPALSTIEQQLDRTYLNFRAKATDLERYIYLASLQDRNETLFFRLLHEHIDEMMPVVYTPVVGEACEKFSRIYRRARGLYISYSQRERIEEILASYPRTPAVIVVTDGERILGLGDQGVGGMGIPIGKLALYTACAGVPPDRTLPIMLDIGTDNVDRLEDPLYLGARHPRLRGETYQAFIDRFVDAVMAVFPGVVLQWEDFLKNNALAQLERFRDRLCTFNDDIQGTAAIVVAGIYAATRVTGRSIRDQRVVLAGAGASGQGIANLIEAAFVDAGVSPADARSRICMVDSRGLVTRDRPHLESFKARYALDRAAVAAYRCSDPARVTLEETIVNFAPTILLGVSGMPGLFSEAVVRAMATVNARPFVFPLSNPTSKSECTAEDAIRWSDGRAIVATGSPSAPVEHAGRLYRVGQCNNAFVFPGVGLGLWVGQVDRVTDTMFLDAAKALAGEVKEIDLARGSVYPELRRIRDCSHAVACAVVRRAVAEGHAAPSILADLDETVTRAMWMPRYRPIRYEPAGDIHRLVTRRTSTPPQMQPTGSSTNGVSIR